MIRILITCLLLLICFFTKAQEPVSIHLSEKDGLPDKEFYNIIEDSKGFIWLCADKGLFRYDGKSFKNYSNKEKRGLSVFNVTEDKLGRIWSNNISGQFFYVENDELTTFIDLGKELNGELSDFVITKNNLIVLTRFNVFYIDLLTKAVTLKFKTPFRFGIPFQFNNKVIFGTLGKISILNTTEKESIIRFKMPKPNKKGNYSVNRKSEIFKLDSILFFKQEHNYKNTFFRLDLDKNKHIKIVGLEELENRKYITFFENDSQLWAATNNGVYLFSYKNDVFQLEKRFLMQYHVTKIIKDKDDNFWFATLNNGVFVTPNIAIERLNILAENSNISCLEKINNATLFFGINNGNVGFYNTKKHTQTIINLPSTSRVSAIKYHPEKQLSFISKDDGGFLLNNKTKKVTEIKGFNTIKSFSIIENNELLFVNYAYANVLNIANLNSIGNRISIDKRAYTSLYSTKNKSAFVAFVDDLVVYDTLWNSKNIRFNKQSIFAISLTETKNGIVWVGTFKDGIFGVENNKVLHHFTTKNGLISNRIEKIKADQNNLWIATDNGIQLLDIKTKNIKTLTKRDGVVSYDVSGIEVLDSKVFFSSNKGLFSIDKTKGFKAPKPVEVYFTDVEVNEKPTKIISNYKLDYNQNTIKIGFNVNGFQFSQKGKYEYRLLGLNEDWINTEAGQNAVKYNSLPYGEFKFQIRPILESEEKENSIKEVRFTIKKPFWKTWWFILVASTFVISSIVFYFRRKIKKEEKQRKEEVKKLSLDKELIALKLENLRSQMNPHFIFNALNSIQEYIVLNQKKLASEYLGKFADLIRTYLNHSTKGNITLQEEIDCLEMYLELEKLRFEDKLQYAISTSENLKPDQMYIPTMLIQPYVENALKHGLLHRKTDRILKINFFINEATKMLKCIIIDNGVGREQAAKYKARSGKNHESFATKATQDRLTLLNYGKAKEIGVIITDLYEKEIPTGTQVEITIPFKTH